MANQLVPFNRDLATALQPLRPLPQKKCANFLMNDEQTLAFESAKAILTSNNVQFSSVQFSCISAPPHEQNNKMLRSLCVVKDGVRKRKKQQNEFTL